MNCLGDSGIKETEDILSVSHSLPIAPANKATSPANPVVTFSHFLFGDPLKSTLGFPPFKPSTPKNQAPTRKMSLRAPRTSFSDASSAGPRACKWQPAGGHPHWPPAAVGPRRTPRSPQREAGPDRFDGHRTLQTDQVRPRPVHFGYQHGYRYKGL